MLPFIPPDTPKSFVVITYAGLIALFIFGPTMWLGKWLDVNWLLKAGYLGFFTSWVVVALTLIVSALGNLTGRDKNIEATQMEVPGRVAGDPSFVMQQRPLAELQSDNSISMVAGWSYHDAK